MTQLPSEHAEQAAVIAWARAMQRRWPELGLLYAIPNGARTSWSVAKKLRAEGMAKGVPDLCLPVARGAFHACYLELKRRRGGQLTAVQRGWIDALTAQGNFVRICRGADWAIHWLTRYLTQEHLDDVA